MQLHPRQESLWLNMKSVREKWKNEKNVKTLLSGINKLPGREFASTGLATSTQCSMSVSANVHDNNATLSATLLVKLFDMSASALLLLAAIFFGKKGSRMAVERNNQSAVSGSRI